MHQIHRICIRLLSHRTRPRLWPRVIHQVTVTLRDIGLRRFLLGLGRKGSRDLFFAVPTNCELVWGKVVRLSKTNVDTETCQLNASGIHHTMPDTRLPQTDL